MDECLMTVKLYGLQSRHEHSRANVSDIGIDGDIFMWPYILPPNTQRLQLSDELEDLPHLPCVQIISSIFSNNFFVLEVRMSST